MNPTTCRHGRTITYSDTGWCDRLKHPDFTPGELQNLRLFLTETLNEYRLDHEPQRAITEIQTKLLCLDDEIAGI